MHWYLEVLRKYAEFSGRARRSEYWFFALFNILISIGLGIIDVAIIGPVGNLTMPMGSGMGGMGGMGGTSGMGTPPMMGISLLTSLYNLAVLVPSIAVAVRRMHDTGRSGWWVLIVFVPIIGGIIFLIFALQDSEPSSNQYGANPKALPQA